VLQSLYNCSQFRHELYSQYELNKKHWVQDKYPSMVNSLAGLFNDINNAKNIEGVLSPTAFVKAMKANNEQFQTTQHQDAQELLIWILNQCNDTISKAINTARQQQSNNKGSEGKKSAHSTSTTKSSKFSTSSSNSFSGPSPISNDPNDMSNFNWLESLFCGICSNVTECVRCGLISCRDEKFFDLSLDLADNTSISHCFKQFTSSYIIGNSDKYLCENCCFRQEAKKSVKIKLLPNYLILHLKRFKFNETAQSMKKLCYRVVFPVQLRLASELQGEVNYRLVSIVVHIGAGMKYGHYISIVWNSYYNEWLLYDDETITHINETQLKSCFGSLYSTGHQDGYLLFYEKVPA
jgi:ubiquitin carboxyl-terminal hydrolase 12/46